jgi:dTDP-4-dehydrorhamnose 3,5-epimerase
MGKIDGVLLTPLNVIHSNGGDVFHAMKAYDAGYLGFGEAYFSSVESRSIKPWKRHRRMTLNLVVIYGVVRFVIHDNRQGSQTYGITSEYRIGLPSNYVRLTVPPNLWVAFQGISAKSSLILNIADLAHDPDEVDRGHQEDFIFDWSS